VIIVSIEVVLAVGVQKLEVFLQRLLNRLPFAHIPSFIEEVRKVLQILRHPELLGRNIRAMFGERCLKRRHWIDWAASSLSLEEELLTRRVYSVGIVLSRATSSSTREYRKHWLSILTLRVFDLRVCVKSGIAQVCLIALVTLEGPPLLVLLGSSFLAFASLTQSF